MSFTTNFEEFFEENDFSFEDKHALFCALVHNEKGYFTIETKGKQTFISSRGHTGPRLRLASDAARNELLRQLNAPFEEDGGIEAEYGYRQAMAKND